MDKGWRCCKARVLTFDEFLSIPPCTTGEHSTVQMPAEKTQERTPDITIPKPVSEPTILPIPFLKSIPDVSLVRRPTTSASPFGLSESESDDPAFPIPPEIHCRRRGCKAISQQISDPTSRFDERCNYHSGQPIFHEGSKGWTCCKRRVLEFEEFMRIEGCQQRDKHLFVGTRENENKERIVANVR